MKKTILLMLSVFLLCGCQKEDDFDKGFIDESKKTVENEIEEEKFVDDNPVKIALYLDDAVDLYKSPEKLEKPWVLKKDIVVFGSFYTDEETIKSDYFQYNWKRAAEKYEDYEKYKTGWRVSFELKDGSKIDRMIFKPSDVEDFYDYLEIYLYDSAHQPLDAWYSHLLDTQMNDETILTSMKLTCGSKYEEIVSNINVQVFTYDGEEDFDSDGNYRGNSYFNVEVIDSNKK